MNLLATTAEAAALQTMLRANAMVRAEIGKLLRTQLAPPALAFWTDLDTARAIEANALERLLEASRPGKTT